MNKIIDPHDVSPHMHSVACEKAGKCVRTGAALPTARAKQVGGNHYRAMNVQPWDVIDGWPIEQQIGFYRGNAVKYLLRFGSKGRTPAAQVEDLNKARHYLVKLSEVLSTGDE